jgi:hypothetical protein
VACAKSGRNGTLAILGEIISPRINDDPHIEGFLTMSNQRGSAAGLALIALTVVLVFSLTGCFGHHESVKFDTPYQAVLLGNGSVYFGHLDGYGTRHPVLTDVFYIVSQTDPTTKETKNVLVKRGKELHAPDRMYLTPTAIIFVEPVGKDSKVAQLISQAEH